MNLIDLAALSLSLALVTGCGGGHAAATANAAPTTFAEQVKLGQALYGEQCASCHGASGKGGGAPAVVGIADGALPLAPRAGAKGRTTEFKTVADVADYVVKAMPPGKAGSLSTEQYFAILAFDLEANGIHLEQKLDAPLAGTLVIPR